MKTKINSKLITLKTLMLILVGLAFLNINPFFLSRNLNSFIFMLSFILMAAAILSILYGMALKKSWTLSLITIVSSWAMYMIFKNILFFGIYGKSLYVGISFFIFAAISSLLKNKDLQRQFVPSSNVFNTQKAILSVIVILVIFSFASHLFVISKLIKKAPIAFCDSELVYPDNSFLFDSGSPFEETNAFGWALSLPKDLHKTNEIPKGRKYDPSVIFKNDENSVYCIINQRSPLLTDDALRIKNLINIKRDYDFIKKIYDEPLGQIFLMIKTFMVKEGTRFYEITLSSLKGFLNKSLDLSGNSIIYEYTLFDPLDHHISVTFLIKQQQFSEERIDSILNTLRFTKGR